jgi:hypothetical protein
MLNGTINKTLTALITGLIGWATLVVNSPSASITSGEWIELATAVAVALGVYTISNAPSPPTPPSP